MGARTAVVMAPPADTLVHALKYGGWPELARPLAARMIRALPPGERVPDLLVVPVPTTPSREKARGYNQAERLGDALASALGRPLARAIVRVEGGGTQVALHRHQRRANVEGAFRPAEGWAPRIRGRPILLVDDVLTTGATAGAAATTLASMGAGAVNLLAFARALPDVE